MDADSDFHSVLKFNPFHDSNGRFTHGGGGTGPTVGLVTDGPSYMLTNPRVASLVDSIRSKYISEMSKATDKQFVQDATIGLMRTFNFQEGSQETTLHMVREFNQAMHKAGYKVDEDYARDTPPGDNVLDHPSGASVYVDTSDGRNATEPKHKMPIKIQIQRVS